MSIWATSHTIRSKKYGHSNVDPRKAAPPDDIDLAVVMDYVYNGRADARKILPYLRVSVGPESTILTRAGAKNLRDALTWFIDYPKVGSHD